MKLILLACIFAIVLGSLSFVFVPPQDGAGNLAQANASFAVKQADSLTVLPQDDERLLPSAVFLDKELSMEEQIGQMMMIGFEGTHVTSELEELFARVKPGGVLLLGRNLVDENQTKQLIEDLQAISLKYIGIPLWVAIDQEGGVVTRLWWTQETTPQRQLDSFEETLKVGRRRAKELKELGINMNLAPVLDSANEDDYLFSRSFQKDPAQSARLAKILIVAHRMEGVEAVLKHFPGYDGISINPETTIIPRQTAMPDTVVFADVLDDTNSNFVMVAHVIYEDVDPLFPFPLSRQGGLILRERLGPNALVIGDDLLSRAFVAHYTLGQIAQNVLNGQVDILLASGHSQSSYISSFYENLVGTAKEDLHVQSRVKEASGKILAAKKEMFGAGGDLGE
ncbi:MAG: hypothetical protein A3E07_02975 [Candidatus Wildermuthbacteria bacterium RIFCSPHIGHO2_12_FULL_45_9]|nr:MAG: hypothetical protein A2748_01340 [Candidatus Wildermuthbacteria bacterium RIFCSPHIGHO2_01_FULL_45_20]OHA71088.1 MAG: hypothetical protein A3E07_02975 [Candidatus Wildermuthbacteria bacterium RIFCSPHIGHO2_12_FULL_45_9]